MQNVLSKTASDLGWSGTSVTSAGSQGYQLKRTYGTGKTVQLALTEVSDSDMALLMPGTNRETFIKKRYEALPSRESEYGANKSRLIELSGFEACVSTDWSQGISGDEGCHDHSDTMFVIGSYWGQVISNVFSDEALKCEKATDSMPLAKVFIENLSKALK